MTILLQDSFARTGALDASAPDLVDNAVATWIASGNLTCASGKVNVANAMSTGRIECSTTTTLSELNLTVSLTTGMTLSFPMGQVAEMRVELGNYVYVVSLSTPGDGSYALNMTTGSGYSGPNYVSHGPFPVTLLTNATYPIVIAVSGTAQSITAFGQLVSTTETYTETAAPTYVDIGSSPTISIGPVYLGTPITVAPITGNAALTAPMGTLRSALGAQSSLKPRSPTLLITGHNSFGEQAAFLTAPSPTLSITTGANANVAAPSPTPTLSATGTNWGTADLTAPAPTLAATMTAAGMATADLTTTDAYALIGYSGAVVSITTTGKASLQATGTTGGIASIAVTCPLFELTSTGTALNHGSVDLLAPSPRLGGQAQAWLMPPMAKLTAIGAAVVTATYEAYAVNLKHTPRPGVEPVDEMTRYTNFPFTHVVRYLNSYYGVNSTGMYLLEGTTDDAVPIPFAVKTAMTDFKSPTKKTLASAYFGGRFGPASTVQLYAGEDTPNTYSYSTPRDTLAQNHRQVFGKGLKERYYALGVSGTGTLELDSIELDVHNITRRI